MKHAQCVALLAVLTWIQHSATCLKVGPQQQPQQPQQTQQVTANEVTAVMAFKQQQQQQQQQHQLQQSQQQQTFVEQQPPNAANQAASAKPTPAKANNRLVSKLKDHARHRRRHRHNRHRHYLAERLKEPQGASTTLTALESIVEEVSRVGGAQVPPADASALNGVPVNQVLTQPALLNQQSQSQQQQQQQQPQQQANQQQPSTAANSATEVLLEGSAPPVSHLVQQQQQQPLPPLSTQMVQHLPAAPVMPVTRLPTSNSRGFFLTSMLSKILGALNVTEFAVEMREGISSRASCVTCNAIVGIFMSPLYSKEVFSAAIQGLCTSFKIQTARVCAGLVETFQDDFEYIRKHSRLSRDEICGVVFGVDCARRQTQNLFWTVNIPEPTQKLEPPPNERDSTAAISGSGLPVLPPSEQAMTNMEDAPDLFEYRKSGAHAGASSIQIRDKQQQLTVASSTVRPNDGKAIDSSKTKTGKMLKRPQYIFDDEHMLETNESPNADGQPQQQSNNNDKVSSFVHITDIHIDPYYEPGSLNDCNEPLCCRATSGPVAPGDKRRQAGRWGDYGNCDTPVRTLRSALNRIREQHSNAEYWIWTGDISPHDIWNQTKSESINHVRLVSKMVREYSNGIPVFPVIGNHEAHPVNSFSTPDIKISKYSMSWLYDALADEWSDWLPNDAQKTFRVGGFYKLQVRRGFRIIALNTNYCARLNPWSFYNPVDPGDQLKWLVEELLEAELNQDKVHIIGHVPPDNRECTQAWLFNFINIVDRFKDTILAQFYGHTHRDEWRIIYSLKRPDDPIGIQLIGPSITPFTENNPAYRLYHQDRTGRLIDSETYYFNLTEANAAPDREPSWQYAYSWQSHLNLTQGTGAPVWHQYVQRMYEDDEIFDYFYKRFYRFSDVKSGQVCRNKCKFQMLGDLRLSHPYKTKPKPFLANRKTSNHHRDRHGHDHHHHHHHHHKRLRHSD